MYRLLYHLLLVNLLLLLDMRKRYRGHSSVLEETQLEVI